MLRFVSQYEDTVCYRDGDTLVVLDIFNSTVMVGDKVYGDAPLFPEGHKLKDAPAAIIVNLRELHPLAGLPKDIA
jgi:hypothetical protein